MKNRGIFAMLAVFLLLNLQAVNGDINDFSSISFSDELAIGDSFTRIVNEISDVEGMAPQDTVKITIIGDPGINIYEGNDTTSQLNSIFNITVNDTPFTLELDRK